MEIKTERLTVRTVQANDWRAIQEIWKRFSVSPYAQYDIKHNTQDEDVRARIARWAACSDPKHRFFAVCLGQAVIGYIACNASADGYELGYCFHSDYYGRGYAKESHLALLRALRAEGITQFSAGTALNNLPSVALLTSLGFRQVGAERVSFYQDANGAPIVFEGGVFALTLP